MTRLLTAASLTALLLAACGDPDEPGDFNSNIEPGESGALADLDDEGVDAGADGRVAGGATEDDTAAASNGFAEPNSSGGAGALPGGAFTVIDGWVRNPAGGRAVTAGYFTLKGGGEAARLVGVGSAEADRIEMHTMELDGDVMRMRQVDAMDVPPNGALTLQSGGDHLMIFDLAPDAAEDGALDLVLELDDGRRVDARLPFADSAPAPDVPGQN